LGTTTLRGYLCEFCDREVSQSSPGLRFSVSKSSKSLEFSCRVDTTVTSAATKKAPRLPAEPFGTSI